MIVVTYVYDGEGTICEYRRSDGDGRAIVLPRQEEFVDIDNVLYRVEMVTHVLSIDAYDTKQQIIIKLSRQHDV